MKRLSRKYPWPIQVSCDDSLKELVKLTAKENNISESKVVVQALTFYLSERKENYRIILSRLSELRDQLASIKYEIVSAKETAHKGYENAVK